MDEHLKSQPKRIGIGRLFKSVGLVMLCGCFVMLSGADSFQTASTDTIFMGASDDRAVAVSQDIQETSEVTIQTEYETAEIENRQYVQYTQVSEQATPLLQYQLNCFVSKKTYTYDMLVTDITQTMQSYQDLVSYEVIGQSVKGRAIYALKVGHGETQVLITAGVHAREIANTPMIMQCLFDFLFAYTSDANQYANVLDRVTFVVVPLVNPDGYQYCIDKKNGRKKTNSNNVDINRNFPCKYWGSKIKKPGNFYPGPAPASEPETQTIMALFDQYSFTLAVDIHSRGRQIICMKGGYTPDDIVAQEDPEALNAISLSLAQNLLTDIKYKLIKELYVKMGERGTLTDYAFSRGVPTITFETCKYKDNRLPKASDIQKEYQFFNWPGTLYKIAEFAANLNVTQ